MTDDEQCPLCKTQPCEHYCRVCNKYWDGFHDDISTCPEAYHIAIERGEEIDRLLEFNHSVCVCEGHTEDIIQDRECVICELQELYEDVERLKKDIELMNKIHYANLNAEWPKE